MPGGALRRCEGGHTYRRRRLCVRSQLDRRSLAAYDRHPCFPEVTALRTTLRELTALVGRPDGLAVEWAYGPRAAVSWPCGCAAEGDDFYDLQLASCVRHREARTTPAELRFRLGSGRGQRPAAKLW